MKKLKDVGVEVFVKCFEKVLYGFMIINLEVIDEIYELISEFLEEK